MGVQSVVKTGVSSIPKPPTSNCYVHQDSQIKCSIAEPLSHDFFALGQGMAGNNPNSVKFYDVAASSNNGPAPVSNRAFIVAANAAVAYVEASRPVWVINKESLTSLLEFADNAGCSTLFACVRKDAPMSAEIIRSYGANGFSMVAPNNSAAGESNYIKLAFAI